MNYILAKILLGISFILGFIVQAKLSDHISVIIIVNLFTIGIVPLSLYLSRLQWNFYQKLNKSPIINTKINWLLVGAFIYSILLIILNLVALLTSDKEFAFSLTYLPGVSLGYLLALFLKKAHNRA